MKKDSFKNISLVKGAASKKGIIEVLKMIHHYDDRVQCANGHFVIDAPFKFKDSFTVNAAILSDAIDNCDEDIKMELHEKGRLKIESGTFKVSLAVTSDTYPVQELKGDMSKFPAGIENVLKQVSTFIGTDASRTWALGCLVHDNQIFATNNAIAVKAPFKIGKKVHTNIPGYMIHEIVSKSELPSKICTSENSIGVIYKDTTWFRGQQLSTKWPDMDDMITEIEYLDGFKVPENLQEELNKIAIFCDENEPYVYLSDKGIRTSGETKGAKIEGFNLPAGKFRIELLQMVLSVATHIDFSRYPAPCPFYNEDTKLKGILMGVK